MLRTNEEKILSLATKTPFTSQDAHLIKTLLLENPNWQLLLELAATCEVLPLATENLLRLDSNTIPRTALSKMAKYYRSEYTLNNIILWNEFRKLHTLAKTKEIPIIPIKGIVLTSLLYNDMGLRRSSDIDILIKKEHLESLTSELVQLGYPGVAEEEKYQISDRKNRVVDFHLSFKKDYPIVKSVMLNLHWDILPSSGHLLRLHGTKIPSLIEDFWRKASIRKISNEEVLTLSVEDLFFLSAIELYKDMMFYRHFLLKRNIDISRILYLFGKQINWEEIAKRSDIYGIKGLIYYILYANKEIFNNGVLPKEIVDRIQPSYGKRIFINSLSDHTNYSEHKLKLHKLLLYYFISEVILFSNRWKVFFLRLFYWISSYWGYPSISFRKKTQYLNYFVFRSLRLIRKFLQLVFIRLCQTLIPK